jgi:hypothetical protein
MRWLYVPNESNEGEQIGPRMAFEKLQQQGVFSDYAAYSYLVRQKALNNHQDALREFLDTACKFQPDVIFIQHPNNGYPMDRSYLQQLKAIASKPKLVLFEADPYGYIVKRMDATLKAVIAETDICYLVGTGVLADMAHAAGAKLIRFAPHSYDSLRFGQPWQATSTRSYDAVMIANLPVIKGIPWLYVPGGRKRKQTAETLHKFLGQRFAVYGSGPGWGNAPYCKGRLDFNKQDEAIRDAWMSVNWGQYDDIAMYASDRLPISLACGVPHITNYQTGYEHVFNNIPGLYVIKDPKEAADAALHILSLTIEQRNELGNRAAEYAKQHLEASVVYSNMVTVIAELIFNDKLHQ